MFLGVLIYIGIYNELCINMYQNIDKDKGLIYIISAYIILNYYKDIKRYYYILDIKDNKRQRYYLLINDIQ